MATTTLAQVETWLREQPTDKVMCWNTFDLWHSLLNTYFAEQGYANLRDEYDQMMIDPPKTGTSPRAPRVLASYDDDLTQFKYCLHSLPLCYSPTAGALLTYMESGAWHNGPDHSQIPWHNPELHNAHYDDPARPDDVHWKHLDLVQIQGKTYRAYSSVFQPSFLKPGESIRSAEINIERDGWRDLNDLICYVGSEKQPEQYIKFGHPITAQWIRTGATVDDRNILTLETVNDVLGSWQRQGEILVKIA